MPAPGCLVPGRQAVGDPPGWLLLRAVRILLECILGFVLCVCLKPDVGRQKGLIAGQIMQVIKIPLIVTQAHLVSTNGFV